MSETTKNTEQTKSEKKLSFWVAIVGLGLFTILLLLRAIRPIEYSYLITVTLLIALAILFGQRLREIRFGSARLILDKLESIEKKVSETELDVNNAIRAIEEFREEVIGKEKTLEKDVMDVTEEVFGRREAVRTLDLMPKGEEKKHTMKAKDQNNK